MELDEVELVLPVPGQGESSFTTSDVGKGENDLKDGVKDGVKKLTDLQENILDEMRKAPSITTSELAQKINVKFRTLQRYIAQLQSIGFVSREGGRKEGRWVIAPHILEQMK